MGAEYADEDADMEYVDFLDPTAVFAERVITGVEDAGDAYEVAAQAAQDAQDVQDVEFLYEEMADGTIDLTL